MFDSKRFTSAAGLTLATLAVGVSAVFLLRGGTNDNVTKTQEDNGSTVTTYKDECAIDELPARPDQKFYGHLGYDFNHRVVLANRFRDTRGDFPLPMDGQTPAEKAHIQKLYDENLKGKTSCPAPFPG